jgi:hypothetical protein
MCRTAIPKAFLQRKFGWVTSKFRKIREKNKATSVKWPVSILRLRKLGGRSLRSGATWRRDIELKGGPSLFQSKR